MGDAGAQQGEQKVFRDESGDELDQYAWYAENSGGQTHPVDKRSLISWNYMI